VMRWYVQDEVNQDYSEQNEVDGMKKGADHITFSFLHTSMTLRLMNSLTCVLQTFAHLGYRNATTRYHCWIATPPTATFSTWPAREQKHTSCFIYRNWLMIFQAFCFVQLFICSCILLTHNTYFHLHQSSKFQLMSKWLLVGYDKVLWYTVHVHGLGPASLHFCILVIPPVFKYAAPVWRHLLCKSQSDNVAANQKMLFASQYIRNVLSELTTHCQTDSFWPHAENNKFSSLYFILLLIIYWFLSSWPCPSNYSRIFSRPKSASCLPYMPTIKPRPSTFISIQVFTIYATISFVDCIVFVCCIVFCAVLRCFRYINIVYFHVCFQACHLANFSILATNYELIRCHFQHRSPCRLYS